MNLVNLDGRTVVVEPEDAHTLMDRGFTRPVLLRRHPEGVPGSALVARPYGGLGDMICLRPAVLQLAEERDLTLLIEARYFCLFPEIDRKVPYPYDLALTQHRYSHGTGAGFELVFENDFDEHAYETVYDCWCPCGDHEFDCDYRPKRNRVENFAAHLGVAVRPPDMRPAINRVFGDAWWLATGLGGATTVGFQVRTMHRSKDWPMDCWRSLAGCLEARGIRVVAFDAEDDISLSAASMPCSGRSLPDVGGVIAGLDAMVAADSGLMHYALALGVPTVGIFGPTDGTLTMRAYNGQARWTAVQAQVSPDWGCRAPCYYSRKTNGYFCEQDRNAPMPGRCLATLPVAPVLQAVLDILSGGTDVSDQS